MMAPADGGFADDPQGGRLGKAGPADLRAVSLASCVILKNGLFRVEFQYGAS